MNIKTKLFFLLLFFTSTLTFTLFSCSSPTDPPIIPPPPPPTEPDSTTQNFIFETFEFGSGGASSSFNDVWIFNENNIWAVGWVDVTSTSGRTNIVRWDGTKWGGFGVQFNTSGIYGIWAQDTSTIFFALGAVIEYKNGSFIEHDFTNLHFSNNQSVNKLWGSSENNVYGVGRNGIIVHYDGSKWTKIDFDTQWTFTGITGNSKTEVAYAAALNKNNTRIIVELKNQEENIIYTSQQVTAVKTFGVKFLNSYLYMSGSDFSSTLIWRYNLNTKDIDSLYTLVPTTGLFNITGEEEIDMFYWGSDFGVGKMVHFNGKRYKLFNLPKASLTTGGASTRGNTSAVVGFSNNKAYITIIKRQ